MTKADISNEFNLNNEYIECAAVSLIREYLARKGYRKTLELFDEEYPRNEQSISSRSKLVEYLSIENLYDKNKSLQTPFKSILELILSSHTAKVKNKIKMESRSFNTRKPVLNSFKKENDICIDDTNEGELYNGNNDKIIDTKNLDDANFKYDFNLRSKNSKLNERTNKLVYKQIDENKDTDKLANEFKKQTLRTNLESNSSQRLNNNKEEFEPKLIEKERKFREKSESDNKTDLINKLDIEPIREKQTTNGMPEPRARHNLEPKLLQPKLLQQNKFLNNSNNLQANAASNDNLVKDYTCKSIDIETAKALRMLLFGNLIQTFSQEWKNQSLNFCDLTKLKFGIVQKKGGPCGVLASIQAYILQELIFEQDLKDPNLIFNVSKKNRTECLAKGLAKLIWKCAKKSQEAVIACSTPQAYFAPVGKYKSDGITETLNLLTFTNHKSLENYLIKNVNLFEADERSGCVLLLFSAIFTRTISEIINDMDDKSNKLMGMHGYCTQEMVNLLIHGRAVSNVFNDSVFLDELELRGPNRRNEIGLLSLFEHYKSCEVGSYYKTPKYPIWVVCSESHFSVIFALRKEILNDWKAETCFDLYYYDGLAKQEEQIRLTLSCKNVEEDPFLKMLNNKNKKNEKDLTPPLELVLRTKWKDASINWNSTEPIL